MSSTSQWSTGSAASMQSACLDPQDIDFDSLIDYEAVTPSLSLSPSTSRSQPTRSTSATPSSNPQSSTQSNNQQNFPLPSHRYEIHKQDTGIVLGALQATLAVNPPNNMHLMRAEAGLPMFSSGFNMDSNEDLKDLIDFGAMDDVLQDNDLLDSTSMFFPGQSSSMSNEFVDPSTLAQEEERSTFPTNTLPSHGRLYPGIHQEQAALAKAQQQQRQQRQQQEVAQQTRSSSKLARNSQPSDPLVEERISQLLKTMRQSSIVTNGSEDDGMTPNAGGSMSHAMRMKKDEDEMDEDERLLASEEGKKLSSKERRQLRNKVSARAFRSRRKEYIGQLENELAIKTNEANELRSQNRSLLEENARLSDLTRMLVSTPAFSSFVDQLSMDGMQNTTSSQNNNTIKQQQPESSQSIPKDVNPFTTAQHQASSSFQGGATVGMALMPDNPIDLNMGNGQNNLFASWGINQPQVFSVLEMPEGPAVDQVDVEALSGKSSDFMATHFSSEAKCEVTEVERMPVIEEEEKNTAHECDEVENSTEQNPAFALFESSTTQKDESAATGSYEDILAGIDLSKAPSQFILVTEGEETSDGKDVSTHTMQTFQNLRESLEAAMQRIERITAHI